jgi:hypothetical protein
MDAFKSLYDLLEGYLAFPLTLVIALACGLGLAWTYQHVKRGFSYIKFMPVAILIIPLAMATLVGLLNLRNSELEASDALRVGVVLTAGVALTRFRSDKLAIEDMVYLVLGSTLGIVLGLGYALYAGISAVALVALLLILHSCRFGEDMGGILSVRIKVPEELNDAAVFQDCFAKHCLTYNLGEVRTVEYGQLYELRYDVSLKKGETIKSLIDEIRLHNGNLEVVVSDAERQG